MLILGWHFDLRTGFQLSQRASGRAYTKKIEGVNKVAASNLGRTVLIGTLGNPHGLLARQLSYTLHKVRDQCPLYRADGKLVDEHLDKKVEDVYNGLLNKASKLRQELSQIVPLGWALETLQKDFGVAMNDKEMSLFNWHLENLDSNVDTFGHVDDDSSCRGNSFRSTPMQQLLMGHYC
ncbi:hypothetical protein KY290_005262 [Solanum tuberosum]|uniref:Uncharacterized protein n=1 Tax=Solanum tuberosum TaxID=4113 RepID=A0ABQ7WE11_SOLTU|nr:hypothetical protein KY289_005657 [Solanum tuberosum]KAH0778835.1 hypothetical protein KY290_005262 [Solanum tuberosum]